MLLKTFTCFACIALFILLASGISYGNKATDSLYALIRTLPDDTSKALALSELAYELNSLDAEEARKYSLEAIALSQKLNFTKGTATGYSRLALAYKQLTYYDSSFQYFSISRDMFAAIQKRNGEASALINIGLLYTRTGENDSAVGYFFRALQLSESINDVYLQGSALASIALAFQQQGKTDDAITYNLKSLHLYESSGNRKSIAYASENLGICYADKKDFTSSEKYYLKATVIYNELEDKRGLGRVNINMSGLLSQQGKLEKAIERAQKAVDLYREIKNPNGEAAAYASLADLSLKKKNYKAASGYANKSLTLSLESGNRQRTFECYQLLHKINFSAKDYKEAYKYLSKASALNDSLFNEKKETIINELQTKYETKKKENEIILLGRDKELSEAKIRRQEIMRNSLIGVAALLLIIGMLLFNRYRISQRNKQQAERMRISSDLHDEVGSTLSSISMVSSFAVKKISKEDNRQALKLMEEISVSALQMGEEMNDIIWAINPRNDSFESIINRLRNYAARISESKNVILNFDVDDSMYRDNISMNKRKNLYLICKEALTNAMKYSGCKNLKVVFYKNKNYWHALVSDDGIGFDFSSPHDGNGLRNMKQRAEQTGGSFFIRSKKNHGTTIELTIRA